MKKFIWIVFMIVLGLACKNEEDEEKIRNLLISENPNQVFEGNFLAGQYKKRNLVQLVLQDPYNQKISHHRKFKGLSMYQSKMIALKNISGLEPPSPITYKPDSAIVKFYQDWSKSENLISNDSLPHY